MNYIVLIIAAIMISSIIVFSAVVHRISFRAVEVNFDDILCLYDKLRYGDSVTLNYDVYVREKKHILSICFENGCKDIPLFETIISIRSSNLPEYGNNSLLCNDYFNFYTNRTHAILNSCIFIKEHDHTIVVYYVKPFREGRYSRLIFSESRVDYVVLYVQNAKLLIDDVEVVEVSGFSIVELRQVLLLP